MTLTKIFQHVVKYFPGRVVLPALLLLVVMLPVMAAETNAAPVAPAAPAPVTTPADSSFGAYLANHQEELSPFFSTHGDTLIKEALPLLLNMLGNILLLNLVVTWVFDVGMSYGFSAFFAPAYKRIKQALIYSTGRVILTLILGVVCGLLLLVLSALGSIALILGGIVLMLGCLVAQAVFVSAIYRTQIIISATFFICLVIVHSLALFFLTIPVMTGRAAVLLTEFVDKTVTQEMNTSTADIRKQQKASEEARDKAKADLTATQTRLDQAKTEEDRIAKEIEAKKNSEAYVYGQVARLHAQGKLSAAHDQFKAFLERFPSGSLNGAAKAQLAQVDAEIAAVAADQKKAEGDAATAAAAARADLLVRAGRGEATLSEMRQALLTKNRAEVAAFLGEPNETASDRWGYKKIMVTNPLTNERFGLTVNFREGQVQGVDYYYNGARR